MTELLNVVAAAALTWASAFRWPTLRRRMRDHAALIKEIKEVSMSAADPLVALLRAEVVELAERDDLENRRSRIVTVTGRVALSVFTFLAATSWLVAGSGWPTSAPSGVLLVIVGLCGVGTGFTLVALVDRFSRR